MSTSARSSLIHPFSLTIDRGRTKEFRSLVQQHERKRKRDDAEDEKERAAPDGRGLPASSVALSSSSTTSILPPAPVPPSAFTQSALYIRQGIVDLHRLLQSQQRDYLNVHRFLSSSSSMSDAERDRLEGAVAAAAVECAAKIEELKRKEEDGENDENDGEEEAEEEGEDLRHHREYIILSLYDALREVTEVLQRMKEQRRRQQKEEAETLHPIKFRDENEYRRRTKHADKQPHSTDARAPEEKKAGEERRGSEKEEKVDAKEDGRTELEAPAAKWARLAAHKSEPSRASQSQSASSSSSSSTSSTSSAFVEAAPPSSPSSSSPSYASPELAMENAALLDALSSNLDALRVAESKASQVGALLQLFHSRVLQQSEQIERIEDNAVSATALVERGVEQLRKAASRGASFRIMVLFMILTLSFSLLFLDFLYD